MLSDEFNHESGRDDEEEPGARGGSNSIFSDENTSEELPEQLVRAAREGECSFMDGWLVDVPWVQGGWM